MMPKLVPLNSTALRNEPVVGNPPTTRPESGVGNCYPGLEADLRNLEARFFPHLVFEFPEGLLISVDVEGAAAAGIQDDEYRKLERLLKDAFRMELMAIEGSFGRFGTRKWTRGRPDFNGVIIRPWTAARLLDPQSKVTVTIGSNSSNQIVLTDRRQDYRGSDGAIAEIYRPGELSESLCSPWTHDFRDCGCWYWASNHPDIVLPAQDGSSPVDLSFEKDVVWMRADRRVDRPQRPATASTNDAMSQEMRHHEINHRWEELDIVLEGSEQRAAYAQSELLAEPLPNVETLSQHLHYAATVEHAVMLMYLTAVFSLRRQAGPLGSNLRADVLATRTELLRVAIGEMRHLRLVNEILRGLHGEGGLFPGAYEPELRIAATIPDREGGRTFTLSPLRPDTLRWFIEIERPSTAVDGLYASILRTLREFDRPEAALVEAVIAEGTDHFRTFRFCQTWLEPYDPNDYLAATVADPNDPRQQALDTSYHGLLVVLGVAYKAGVVKGAKGVSDARVSMRASLPNGILGLCESMSDAGLLPVFSPLGDLLSAP